MTNINELKTTAVNTCEQDDTAKTNALIGYGFMLVGLFTGVFWIVGAIWAMIKKSEAQGSVYFDHFENITATFWWSFVLYIVAFITFFFGIGWFIAMGVAIWSIYRMVKGLARITSNKPFNEVATYENKRQSHNNAFNSCMKCGNLKSDCICK